MTEALLLAMAAGLLAGWGLHDLVGCFTYRAQPARRRHLSTITHPLTHVPLRELAGRGDDVPVGRFVASEEES